jgi:hypothetical protein
MGASGACSSATSASPASQAAWSEARSGNITAKGFSSRCLRWRNFDSAASEAASASSW